MRTALALAAVLLLTPYYAGLILLASLAGVKPREGNVYWWAPRIWSRRICRAAGAQVVTHGLERISDASPRILVSNHVSWFDVWALCGVLPRYAFVAKAELGRIPLFGRAAKVVGQVFIERANRKAAFAEYEKAAARIREGTTVVIFPEGTRGTDYALRPFKKGPFVLAIASAAPIVPLLIHGSMEVHKKDTFRVHKHDIHIHVLDPIPTAGLTYDDRDALAGRVYEAMSRAQKELYGIESPRWGAAPKSPAEPALN
jgi:1-acyl-sn-glycerol-3-phosphate acyltransferase